MDCSNAAHGSTAQRAATAYLGYACDVPCAGLPAPVVHWLTSLFFANQREVFLSITDAVCGCS